METTLRLHVKWNSSCMLIEKQSHVSLNKFKWATHLLQEYFKANLFFRQSTNVNCSTNRQVQRQQSKSSSELSTRNKKITMGLALLAGFCRQTQDFGPKCHKEECVMLFQSNASSELQTLGFSGNPSIIRSEGYLEPSLLRISHL